MSKASPQCNAYADRAAADAALAAEQSPTYRAAYYVGPSGGETVLTAPEHAHMTDAELTAIAWACAQDAGLVDMHEDDPQAAYPRVTRAMLEAGLRIGQWKD